MSNTLAATYTYVDLTPQYIARKPHSLHQQRNSQLSHRSPSQTTRLQLKHPVQIEMAAMAAAASTTQFVSLSSTNAVGSSLRLSNNRVTLPSSAGRRALCVRAAGNPERIDNFVDGAKSDASKNAKGFGDTVKQKAGEVGDTVKDVGRDMGAKAQEAVDAGSRKLDEGGDKAQQIGDDVKGSTKDTLDSASDTRNGQSVVDKASNAASNVGQNVKENLDQGAGAAKGAADDAATDAKKSADRL